MLLYWLPVHFRIDFKVLLVTCKALNGPTPQYISDLSSPYDPARTLRSSGRGLLSVPHSQLKTKRDRAFKIRAPRLWNTLPEEIRQATSVASLKSKLKTYFYRTAFPDFMWFKFLFGLFRCYVFCVLRLLCEALCNYVLKRALQIKILLLLLLL